MTTVAVVSVRDAVITVLQMIQDMTALTALIRSTPILCPHRNTFMKCGRSVKLRWFPPLARPGITLLQPSRLNRNLPLDYLGRVVTAAAPHPMKSAKYGLSVRLLSEMLSSMAARSLVSGIPVPATLSFPLD